MPGPNLKPSQRAATVAIIAPISSVAVLNSGWTDAAAWQNLMGHVSLGVLGAGATVDAKLQQALDAAGTGAKDIAGKAIVQFSKATPDDGKQAIINFRQEDLDVANNFRFVRLVITPAVAASLVSGALFGFDPRYGPADLSAAATQTQIVG